MANGRILRRPVGFAILRVHRAFTIDEVVFARPDDQELLGARTLEGLGLTVDPVHQRLVPSGPIPATGNVRVAPGA